MTKTAESKEPAAKRRRAPAPKKDKVDKRHVKKASGKRRAGAANDRSAVGSRSAQMTLPSVGKKLLLRKDLLTIKSQDTASTARKRKARMHALLDSIIYFLTPF